MQWNWQQKDWPEFAWRHEALERFDRDWLYQSGRLYGIFVSLTGDDQRQLKVELISSEALKTSEVEGEYLNRASLRSSIRRHFGLRTDKARVPPAERGISELMMDGYKTFNNTLDHETLHRWHRMVMRGRDDLADIGRYRSGAQAMQIVSGPVHKPKVHFEAPPSDRVGREMDGLVRWFNRTAPDGREPLPPLARAGIAHLYFESIHPFEDGNGRIGRALSEKALAQALGRPTLLALATVISRKRKAYYDALAQANRKNEITDWLVYFAETTLGAVRYTRVWVEFLMEKARLLDRLRGQINPRQEKLVLRMFREGPEGFTGGLSAGNYISITKAPRASATRDLADLVEKGVLVKTGRHKYTRYRLNVRAVL